MSDTVLEIEKKLQAPFYPDEIEWRVGAKTRDETKGMALPYVTNRAIQNRLDYLFGCFGWRNEFKEWKDKAQVCGISIKHEGEWITKWDGADDSDFEPTKGGLSDSMKRAAVQWGIGRYLYKLEAVWVPIKKAGKSHTIAQIPKLPTWALPEDAKPRAEQAPQKPAPKPGTTITKAEQDKMVALAKGNVKAAKAALEEFGYESSKDVTKADYEKVCREIEKKLKERA